MNEKMSKIKLIMKKISILVFSKKKELENQVLKMVDSIKKVMCFNSISQWRFNSISQWRFNSIYKRVNEVFKKKPPNEKKIQEKKKKIGEQVDKYFKKVKNFSLILNLREKIWDMTQRSPLFLKQFENLKGVVEMSLSLKVVFIILGLALTMVSLLLNIKNWINLIKISWALPLNIKSSLGPGYEKVYVKASSFYAEVLNTSYLCFQLFRKKKNTREYYVSSKFLYYLSKQVGDLIFEILHDSITEWLKKNPENLKGLKIKIIIEILHENEILIIESVVLDLFVYKKMEQIPYHFKKKLYEIFKNLSTKSVNVSLIRFCFNKKCIENVNRTVVFVGE
jgi:hypothetical protein